MNNKTNKTRKFTPANMAASSEKAKDFKGSMKKLIKHNKPFIKLIVFALALSIASSVLAIISPDKIKDITNEIINGLVLGINLERLGQIGLTIIIILSLSSVFEYAQGWIMATVTNKFSRNLRKEISNKINRLPLSYFDRTSIGDVLSRVTNDVDTIGQTMNQSVATLIGSITLFFGALFMIFRTNALMSLAAIASTIIGFLIMIIILKRSQKYFAMVQEELGNMNGHIEEVYSGHNVVKVYNAYEEVNKKFNKINNKLYMAARKSQFYSGLMFPLMSFVGNFGYVSVCVVGALLAMNGTIEFGVIVAFMIYIRLFTNPLSQIAQGMTQLQSTAAAAERVFEFLEEKEMSDEKNIKGYLDPLKIKGDVVFENVKFGYTKDKSIIKNFNVNITSGQKVAIVGPTGAGKTTIVNLLMKFYETDSGSIMIDGKPISNLKRKNIHDLFCMVLQDTWLFEGSIKENVRYNQTHVTDEDIEEACKVVGLDHFIKTLPEGYDTHLTDDALSAGQKQLLTIARAMLEDEPFLILDEATSSVDTRTEILVQKAMDKLTIGRTSFIIAHRLSTIKNADIILVMRDGDIVEQGKHEELLKQNGFYAELYNSQFQN